ncbi:hypothetical protein OOZ58_43085, partial [Streptomyces tauricus]|nr:hypothetical protein [Streptomyces tauricus]
DVVPFLVEDELKSLGGHYSKIGDWEPYVVQDGQLITGQNPASSSPQPTPSSPSPLLRRGPSMRRACPSPSKRSS